MKTLRGKSGVLHSFDQVCVGAGIERVVDDSEVEVDEIDVIKLYAKMVDVGVVVGELVAPSFTSKARRLASTYGIRLRTYHDTMNLDRE